jgi:hypothetical protein
MTGLVMVFGRLEVAGVLVEKYTFRFLPELSDVVSFVLGKVRLIEGLNVADL